MALVAEEISSEKVLAYLREAVALPVHAVPPIDDPLLAGVVRRAAGFLCPCARSTLARAVADSFQFLEPDLIQLRSRTEQVIELLLVNGDLLELDRVTSLDEDARGSWVFAAPPAFTKRPSGAYLMLGLAPDESTPLPPDLAVRIVHRGLLRVLMPKPDEKLSARLQALGFSEISEQAWMWAPKQKSASIYVSHLDQKLTQLGPSGPIQNLQILDGARSPNYYKSRWTLAAKQSGRFVARRPQAYGADLWGYVELDAGEPTRFLDLPMRGARFRGCDAAWRLQMAMDSCQKTPQIYRRRNAGTDVVLDFMGPVPIWAQRRLLALGRSETPENALFACRIPATEADAMEKFLMDYLWLERATT